VYCLCNSTVNHAAPVQERVHCYKCFVSTHEHDYTQYFYNVMARGIGDQEARLPGQPLGHTLRELESHSLKSCDDEKGTIRLPHVHCLLLDGRSVCTFLSSRRSIHQMLASAIRNNHSRIVYEQYC